jgi:uncharacterized membrane protein
VGKTRLQQHRGRAVASSWEVELAALGAFIGLVVVLAIVVAVAIPIGIVWLIVSVIRNVAGEPVRRRGPAGDPAAEQLRYRHASGQIGEAEFEAGMRRLGYEKRG